MTSFLISLLVTAAFFTAAALLGFRLGRSPKPYPLVILCFHIALFFLIALGIGVCMNKVEAVAKGSLATVSLCLAGPPLIVLFVSGFVMLWSKQKKRGWILVHLIAMYCLAASLVGSGIFMALKK